MSRVLIGALALMMMTGPAMAADVTYRQHVRALIEANCSLCHGANSPYYGDFAENQQKFKADNVGPRMDTYADLIFFIGWPDTGAFMRRLDDGKSVPGGKPGNMYEYLGKNEEERQKNLAVLKAWVGEGGWTLKRWEARGNVPGITKEELAKIRVKY
jgi:hypothetical protein